MSEDLTTLCCHRPCHTSPCIDFQFLRYPGLPNVVPPSSVPLWGSTRRTIGSDNIVIMCSQFICTSHREPTNFFRIPGQEIISLARRGSDLQNVINIHRPKKLPQPVLLPRSIAIQEIRDPVEASVPLRSDRTEGVRPWQPRVSPSMNLRAITDSPNDALLEQLKAMQYSFPHL